MKKKAIFLLALLMLTAAACGGDVAGDTPPLSSTDVEPAVTATPAPFPEDTASPGPEYDVFSDPNVLWGSGQDIRGDLLVMPKGTVEISGELGELLTQAAGSNLIAFSVENHGTLVGLGKIDRNEVIIHEELDKNGELSRLIDRYNLTIRKNPEESSLAYQKIAAYLDSFADAHVAAGMSRMYAICREIQTELLSGGYDGTADELSKELKLRLLEDEEFCSLYYGDFTYYTDMLLEFYWTFYLQSAMPVREQFCEWGFAPIYQSGDFESVIRRDMDALENSDLWLAFEQRGMGGTFLRNIGFTQKIFSFAGTAEQILQIENRIGDEERYWLMTAAHP